LEEILKGRERDSAEAAEPTSSATKSIAVTPKHPIGAAHMKIWVDLDNSPHVPLFAPIIEELEARGYSVLVTVRDCFQVCELAKLFGLKHRPIGRHSGKNRLLKVAGLGARALQLAPLILNEKPDLAVSHGSRAQLLASAVLRIPSILMMDYEFARGLIWMRPSWVMIPEMIPDAAVQFDRDRILRYPGIKEDVYVPRFIPDPSIRAELSLADDDLVVTVRPPATEAHYHVPESDVVFHAVIEFLRDQPRVRIVLLPRSKRQESFVRREWASLFETGKMLIPAHAVEGLNLIWHSDLVISGGGTMNREAAALGVPVYSIFQGHIGAVDRYLADRGRLVLVENTDDVRTKIALKRRDIPTHAGQAGGEALRSIVAQIMSVMESGCVALQYNVP
jgi:predicted glycosyltransferase